MYTKYFVQQEEKQMPNNKDMDYTNDNVVTIKVAGVGGAWFSREQRV
jgi:hypothetical protein